MLTARLHFDANYHGQCDVPADLGPVMAVLQVLTTPALCNAMAISSAGVVTIEVNAMFQQILGR